MVVAERDIAHRTDGDGIVDDYRALFDCAESQNTDVGLADYGQSKQSPKYSGIGDGKCAFLNFFRAQLLGTCTLGQVIQGSLDAQDIFLVGVFYYRNDEPPVESHRDADVDF